MAVGDYKDRGGLVVSDYKGGGGGAVAVGDNKKVNCSR